MSFEIILKPETIAFPNGVIYFEINGHAIPHIDHNEDVCELLLNWTQALRALLQDQNKAAANAILTIERINHHQFKLTAQDQTITLPIQDCVTKFLEAAQTLLQVAGLHNIQNPEVNELKNQTEQLNCACLHPEDIQLFKSAIAAINRFEELGYPNQHTPDWTLGTLVFKTDGRIESGELVSLGGDNELLEYFESNTEHERKRIFTLARDNYQQLLKEASSKVFIAPATCLEDDWVQCPKCTEAWQAETDLLIECPKCQTLWRSPITEKV